MITNRILSVILGITSFMVIPVQIVTTLVLGLAVSLTFGLLLLPLSLVWGLLLFPMLALSWLCNKAPGLRDVVGIIFIPWAVVANTFVALMPSMGELEGRALKLMLCGSWPYTWEFWQFRSRKLDLDSADPAAVDLNEIVLRMSSHNTLMNRVLMRIATGQPLDPIAENQDGKGVPQDFAEAERWYRKAAEEGHAGSQNNLGILFENGEGVSKDEAEALAWYRETAANGDANAAENARQLHSRMRRDECYRVVDEFVDSISDDGPPLIGDCATLPRPKREILYALRWLIYYFEAALETTTDETLRSKCESLLSTFDDLFTRLARDWHEIDAEDKEAVARLRFCESFPQWALPLKAKYIDEEQASREAADVTIQVISDRVKPPEEPG